MGIFGTSSPFDQIVEKATLETNTKEDWAVILDICDRVGTSSSAPKECLRSIVRRLNHQDPHVVIQAITLLDACVSNCGLPFHLEIASREFEQEFHKLLHRTSEKTVRDKLLSCLQKWAENEFKTDAQLHLIPSVYNKLKSSGIEFPLSSPSKSKKSGSHKSRDMPSSSAAPSAVAHQEDADLAKAIELSLKEAQAGQQSKSLYPQANLSGASTAGAVQEEKESRKVRALYDFEAAEENELTFYSGEIVFVTDDTDPNWWQGNNQRGSGLFPANFVTADLSVEPAKLESSKKTVQFSEDVEVQSIETEPEVVEIDETKIDRVLHMLHEADPTGDIQDPSELGGLEEQVNQMGPLIDQELEKIDRRHAQLTRLGGELVEALNMYHNLMREPVGMSQPGMPYMKMGGVPPATTSMPHFPQGANPAQFAGYPSYDPSSLPYNSPVMRPPHSAPPSTVGYASPYQAPQTNGLPQPHQQGMNGGSQGPPVSIPSSQSVQMSQQGAQMPQVPQGGPHPQMSMNAPNMNVPHGQVPYPPQQAMMMHQGQQGGGHSSQPSAIQTVNSISQSPSPMNMPPHMAMPPGGQLPQQFGSGQPYPQSQASANAP